MFSYTLPTYKSIKILCDFDHEALLKNVLWNSRGQHEQHTEKYFLTSSEDVRPNQITLKAFRLQKKIVRWKMKGQGDI